MNYAYFQTFPLFIFIITDFNDFYSSTVSKQNFSSLITKFNLD
jgi:hypothetical protein